MAYLFYLQSSPPFEKGREGFSGRDFHNSKLTRTLQFSIYHLQCSKILLHIPFNNLNKIHLHPLDVAFRRRALQLIQMLV